MIKKRIFDIIAIVSSLGILCWLLTDFFGGMIVYLLSYGTIIIPIVILFVISIVETVFSIIMRGINANRIKLFSFGFILLTIIIFIVLQSDLFKSKRILTATLDDDLFYYTLVFRENGNCENEVSGIFGFQNDYHGKYKFYGDTIVFEKIPYSSKKFIPDTLLVDSNEKAIFINKNEAGIFSRKKEWLNYFKIH